MTELLDGIGLNTQPQFWISVLQIIWINVLLSGDNAIVIALACRNLPKKQRFTGMVLGTGVALVLRLIFATIVSTLMLLPYVKIAGGLALFWIAVKLLVPGETSDNGHTTSDSLWRAVKLIAVADVVMSLDNVIAVAAVADGSLALLVFGLGVSIPLIVAGANILMALLNYFPLIIWAGAGLLGWIAGEVIASDPILADHVTSFGPGAAEKFKLICSVLGMAGTVGFCLISRARDRAPRLEPSE
ncbi:MAG: TerC family protein [Pseudolabrys sp.]|jgi:YjbE family integral membrane protein